MELKINQNCPSCGAAIVVNEDDTLIRCVFCDVNNFKLESVADRYVLPVKLPSGIEEENLIYTPYIRFKGAIYYVEDQDVRFKLVDTTRTGVENNKLPVSLGVRPQAMNVKPVVTSMQGRFMRQSVATKSVFIHAVKTLNLFAEKKRSREKQIFHRAFIGEKLSRIYQPYYIKNEKVYDAVTNRLVGPESLLDGHLKDTCNSKQSWEPQFITTACPDCGGLLDGERDCIVLHCTNCETLWRHKNGVFQSLSWAVVKSDDPKARYLPFWQIEVGVSGAQMESFGDFVRFTNQPLVQVAGLDELPLKFWVPAFKLNPKAFLQLSSQLSIGQRRIPVGQTRRLVNSYPVNLNQAEACQAIKTILASTTVAREKRFPLLPQIGIDPMKCVLHYLPFIAQPHDLVEENTHASVQTAALRFGRTL